MKINWDVPVFNGGSTITRYMIELQKKDGTYQESAECDGSNLVTIANLYCEVEMNTLTGTPYSLLLGDLIIARVKAFNVIGDGSFFSNTAGVLIRTVPLAPDNSPSVVSA